MNKNYQITDIKVRKNNPNKIQLYLDYELFAEIDYNLVRDLELFVGKTLSKPTLEIIEQNSKLSKAKNEAIRFLSYRSRSEWEVEKKLQEKKYQPDIIKRVICWLKDDNLINDHIFAKQWARYLIDKKPAGELKLRNELYKKGIDKEIINNVLSSIFEQDEDELSLAHQLIKKRLSSLQSKNMKLEPRRIISLLKSQGFSNSVIQTVYNEYIDNENIEV